MEVLVVHMKAIGYGIETNFFRYPTPNRLQNDTCQRLINMQYLARDFVTFECEHMNATKCELRRAALMYQKNG